MRRTNTQHRDILIQYAHLIAGYVDIRKRVVDLDKNRSRVSLDRNAINSRSHLKHRAKKGII